MQPSQSLEQQAWQQFIGQSGNHSYYNRQFNQLTEAGRGGFNFAAACLGPLWACSRNLWVYFWLGALIEVACLSQLAQAALGQQPWGSTASLSAMLLLAGWRIGLGKAANSLYFKYYNRWRVNPQLPSGHSSQRLLAGVAISLLCYPLVILRYSQQALPQLLEQFPASKSLARASARSIDASIEWLTDNFEGLFDSITQVIRAMLDMLETLFISTPWPVIALLLLLLAWRVAGMRVLVFTALALGYLGVFGFWDKAMSTMALVAASVAICVALGIPIGIWCAKSPRANAILTPLLDFMQTMPSFVYLIPAIAFFSVGKPPAVLATVIFAMPPMIRLTSLGIRQVPSAVIEAMLAFGASPRQLLFKAELPLAVPSIMTGINQSIMMSLSMVVIAALIGAGGLGYDVLFSLQHLEAGKGLLSGLAVVLCAMILDRIVQGKRNDS